MSLYGSNDKGEVGTSLVSDMYSSPNKVDPVNGIHINPTPINFGYSNINIQRK